MSVNQRLQYIMLSAPSVTDFPLPQSCGLDRCISAHKAYVDDNGSCRPRNNSGQQTAKARCIFQILFYG